MWNCTFFQPLSFFLSLSHITQKLCGICKYHTCSTKWLLCYWASSFSGLVRCMSYNWRASATKRSPSTQDALVWQLTCTWLLFTYSRCGTYSQATPGLLNTCITGYAASLLAMNCVQVEVQLLFSLITWFTWSPFSPATKAIAYTCV